MHTAKAATATRGLVAALATLVVAAVAGAGTASASSIHVPSKYASRHPDGHGRQLPA